MANVMDLVGRGVSDGASSVDFACGEDVLNSPYTLHGECLRRCGFFIVMISRGSNHLV